MKEQDLKNIFSKNLIYYRKALKLTQLELAEKLNYSDKAISKWERGESFPDVYTLTELAKAINVTPNDLLSERIKTVRHPRNTQAKIIICLLSIGLVWLIATIAFTILKMLKINEAWLSFICAIPVSSIILIIFSSIWGNRIFTGISVSLLIWTLAMSIQISTKSTLSELWLLYIICIPLQILVILWFLLRHFRKPVKIFKKKENSQN